MIRRAAIMLLAAAGIAIVAVWAAWQALGGNRVRVAQANEWAWPGTSYVAFVLSGEPQAFFENYARRYGSCPYLGGAGFDGGHFSRCPPDTTFNEARAIRFDREGDDRCFIYNHIDVPLPEVTEKPRLFIFAYLQELTFLSSTVFPAGRKIGQTSGRHSKCIEESTFFSGNSL